MMVFDSRMKARLWMVMKIWKYRVIQNDCWGFNNLSYTIHL